MISIRERNRQILLLRKEGVRRIDLGRRFRRKRLDETVFLR